MNKSITVRNLNRKSELVLSEDSYNLVLEYLDWGVAEASHSSVTNTDTIGETVTATFFLPRDIEIVGWIVAQNSSQRAAYKKQLNTLINPQSEMQLEYKEYVLNVRADNSVRYAKEYIQNNEVMCKFTLSFTAYQPLFLLKGGLVQISIVMTPMYFYPLVFSPVTVFGLYPTRSIEYMDNTGDVPTGFVLKLKATGAVVNPMLWNDDTGELIKINYTMAEGDIIEICTLSGNKYIELTKDGVKSNLIGKMDRGSVMFGLSSGINHFRLDATENVGNIEIEFEYAPRYLEVEND